MLKIAVILGSVRDGRQGIKAANFVVDAVKKRGMEVELIDPKEYNVPLLIKRYSDYDGEAPENLNKLARIFDEADAFILVSGEYNHSIQPALSNIMDHFHKEYHWKPSAIVSYSGGNFGGSRAAMQLRVFIAELGMVSIRTILSFPNINSLLDENGVPNSDEDKDKYERRVNKFLNELEWYGSALKKARNEGLPN